MLRFRSGVVVAVVEERPGALEVLVEAADGERSALAYPSLVGDVRPGDHVLLNTTAVELSLGTGGADVVVAVEGRHHEAVVRPGHIMKLRYTPHQLNVLSVEEEDSPHRGVMASATSLEGTPVVWIPLHSMLAPVVAGARATGATVSYVMTDGAALPAPLSRLAARLKASGLLDAVVTAGQAFGGDLEAVSVFSGLLAARHVTGSDVVVVGDGPGNTGTKTTWGSTAVASASSLNSASILGGRPLAVLRISFADERPRHRVISHHSLTALAKVVLRPVHVAVPTIDDEERRDAVWRVLRQAGLHEKHQLVEATGRPALDVLLEHGVDVTSMGRSPGDDPEFFLAAGAGGVLAGRMAAADRAWRRPGG